MKRRNLVMLDNTYYGVPAGIPHLVLAHNANGWLVQVQHGARYIPEFARFRIEYL